MIFQFLQTITDAETDLEIAKIDTEKARDKLSKIRLLLREAKTGEGNLNFTFFNIYIYIYISTMETVFQAPG